MQAPKRAPEESDLPTVAAKRPRTDDVLGVTGTENVSDDCCSFII
jgi:hypothetical protein